MRASVSSGVGWGGVVGVRRGLHEAEQAGERWGMSGGWEGVLVCWPLKGARPVGCVPQGCARIRAGAHVRAARAARSRIPWPTASPKPLPKEPAQPAKPPAPQQPKPRQQQQQQQQPPAPQPKPPAPAPQRPVKAQAQPVQRKATPPTGAGAGAAPQAPPQQPNGRARSPTGRRNSAGEVDHPVPWSGRFAVLSSLEGGSPSSLKKRR